MRSDAFNAPARFLSGILTRRPVLRWLAVLSSSIATVPCAPLTIAKKNRKKKRPEKNEFGCLDLGKKCNGKNNKCCSGVCQGKKPKKGKKDKSECIAHDAGTCQADEDSCLFDSTPCGTDEFSRCFRTTGKASFCGNLVAGDCVACARDTDCEPVFGPGAACVICDGCLVFGVTACFPPGS